MNKTRVFPKKCRNEQGISLVETMVASVLGIIVVGAALDVFVTQHAHVGAQKTKADLQQDLRWGTHLLASELRLAGLAVSVDAPVFSTAAEGEIAFQANVNGVQGTLAARSVMGQDWIQVRTDRKWTKGKSVVLCGPLTCEEHVLAKDSSTGRLALTGRLANDFPIGSRVETVNDVRYYLSKRDPQNHKLMRDVYHGANQLVELVEYFSLSYLDQQGRPEISKREIRLVRIHLITKGEDSRGGVVRRSHIQELGVRAL
jgi:Tfp pilus assembly protein PilW